MMDEGPIKKSWKNPAGYYEDSQLVEINNGALTRWPIGKQRAIKGIDPQWAAEFAVWIANRAATYKKWGFKDPRMIGFIHWTFQFLKDPVFIWTTRSEKQVVKSLVKKFGFQKKLAKKQVNAYQTVIKKYLRGKRLYRIDLEKYVPESILIEQLEKILWRPAI